MPWLWLVFLGLIGIVMFNYGAFFLWSSRWLGAPLLILVAGAAAMGQGSLAVGLVTGGALWAGTVLLAVVQWQRPTLVPRRQIWWLVVVGLVALLAVVGTAVNGRVSRGESWAVLVLGIVAYVVSPRTGERLVWWRWLIGLALGVGGAALTAWAMPTVGAVCGCSPMLVGTLLAPCGLISTTWGLWQKRTSTPAVVLTNAVGGMVTGLITVGWGLLGVIGGAWTVGATTGLLTMPCWALTFVAGVAPLLLRQKITRAGCGLLLAIYVGYLLLLWL